MTRVAALQFATGDDVGENLVTCLRVIDAAAECCPDVMVLPEFCNHISWYDNAEHARMVALALEGSFLEEIACRARRHNCYIVINVSLRRSRGLTVTSLLYSPAGALLAQADKQTLMGHENLWFERADRVSEVVNTPVGRLAMFPCRDGVTFETPRGLALRGAQLFCDSLNSFALDEASLHVPARAPENRCFLAAANKVGPLIPLDQLDQVSAETGIPRRFLNGAGESQIVSPQGDILARAPREGECFVWADIDVDDADCKLRADGSHIFQNRRPELYGPLVNQPECEAVPNAGETALVACLLPPADAEAALDALPQLVAELPATTRLAVLPELFAQSWPQDGVDVGNISAQAVIDAMRDACRRRPGLALCADLVQPVEDAYTLRVVLVSDAGVIASQDQLHDSARFPGLVKAQRLRTIDLPWCRLALMSADDLRYPEAAKLAALAGAQVIAVPGRLLEPWEATLALPSRAAENRLSLVYSARPLQGRAGVIATLHEDFTLMTPWRERAFDGHINQPLLTPQVPGSACTLATVNPVASLNKLMSTDTDLLAHRPRHLCGGIIAASP